MEQHPQLFMNYNANWKRKQTNKQKHTKPSTFENKR